MAADYLRRLATQRPRGRQGVRDTATDTLARALATILQVVRDPEIVYKAVQQEFGMTERVLTGLRKRVGATKPLFTINLPRPVAVGQVVHMERMQKPASTPEAAAAEQPTTGRRGRRSAAA